MQRNMNNEQSVHNVGGTNETNSMNSLKNTQNTHSTHNVHNTTDTTVSPGTLFVVATPIGNLGDITARALQTLRDVDFIAAEDTRVTRKLLTHFDIKKPLISYYEHNSRDSGERIIARIISGESCALVTDAGTPCVSDPGEDLVRQCVGLGICVLTLPGPCAAVAALSISGLPAGRFTFEGFLSTSSKSRFEHLNALKTERRTMVFYEAPHKLLRTLTDMLTVFGDRPISITRELTKMFEETLRTNLSGAVDFFTQTPPRGEFVLVIDGDREAAAEPTLSGVIKEAENLINGGYTLKDAVKKAAEAAGVSRNALYSALLEKRKQTQNEESEA